jgi:hypothetical protein
MKSRKRKITTDWEKIRNSNPDSIGFTYKWANDLNAALIKHKNDNEFIMDLLESAVIFWSDEMSDEEKLDSFVFILGILSRK